MRDTIRAVEQVAGRGAPVLVMTYWNLVLRYGVDAFARDLAAAGGAGLITPDLIPDEAADWIAASDAHGLDRVFLVAPSSTPERLASTAAASRGFVYAASTMGVTGERDDGRQPRRGARRATPARPVPSASASGSASPVPSRPREVAGYADGVIVGSALVRTLLDAPDDAAGRAALARADGRPRRGRAVRDPERPVSALLPLAIPSPSQGVWHLGPFPLRAYAFAILLGIVVALWMTRRRWVERGGEPDTILEIAFWAVPFGIVGGRIYHVITSPDAYFGVGRRPRAAPCTSGRAASASGARSRSARVGAWIGCRRQGVRLAPFADALAPGPARGAGDRPARQLVQPGAVRRPDDAAVGPAHRRRRTCPSATPRARCSTRRSSTRCSGTSRVPRC